MAAREVPQRSSSPPERFVVEVFSELSQETIQGRWQHRHDLDAHLGQWTATHDAPALMHLLQEHGVPAGTVHTIGLRRRLGDGDWSRRRHA